MKVPGRRSAILSIILFAAGCSGHRVVPSSSTPVPVQKAPVIHPQEGWSPQMSTGARSYLVHDSSTVSIGNDTASSLPIEATAIYSTSLTPKGDSFYLAAAADSMTMNSHLQTSKDPQNTGNHQGFSAFISSRGRVSGLTSQQSADCAGGMNPIATRIFELTLTYPVTEATIGSNWSDSVSTTACHGRATLLQRSIRAYKLLKFTSWKNRAVAEIQRTVSTIFSDVPNSSTNHFSITGSGTGSGILYVDRATGELLESNSQSQLAISVVTSRGVFPFTQFVTTHIEVR
jgi:hypothetical protein